MKNDSTQFGRTTAALVAVLAIICLASSRAKAQEDQDRCDDGGAIVGLWQEHYTSDFGPQFDTYAQWHNEGLEFETPSFLNGICMGTFKLI